MQNTIEETRSGCPRNPCLRYVQRVRNAVAEALFRRQEDHITSGGMIICAQHRVTALAIDETDILLKHDGDKKYPLWPALHFFCRHLSPAPRPGPLDPSSLKFTLPPTRDHCPRPAQRPFWRPLRQSRQTHRQYCFDGHRSRRTGNLDLLGSNSATGTCNFSGEVGPWPMLMIHARKLVRDAQNALVTFEIMSPPALLIDKTTSALRNAVADRLGTVLDQPLRDGRAVKVLNADSAATMHLLAKTNATEAIDNEGFSKQQQYPIFVSVCWRAIQGRQSWIHNGFHQRQTTMDDIYVRALFCTIVSTCPWHNKTRDKSFTRGTKGLRAKRLGHRW